MRFRFPGVELAGAQDRGAGVGSVWPALVVNDVGRRVSGVPGPGPTAERPGVRAVHERPALRDLLLVLRVASTSPDADNGQDGARRAEGSCGENGRMDAVHESVVAAFDDRGFELSG